MTGRRGDTGPTGPYGPQKTLFSVANCSNESSFIDIFPTDIIPSWSDDVNPADCGQRLTFPEPEFYGSILPYRVPYSSRRMTLSGFVTL